MGATWERRVMCESAIWGTKGLPKAYVPQNRKGSNPLSFLFYSTTLKTKIRIRFWLQGLEKEEINLVLNSVCLTMNHSTVADYCVTRDVSPQFLQTEMSLTNQLTPRTRVLRNLASPRAVKFPALYGIRKFIITFTRPHHLFLIWARSIQSKPSFHFLKIHFNLIFAWPCIIDISNIDNQLDATITAY